MKNKRANIMINLLMFILGLGCLIAFISPINSFIDMAQQSDQLNCKGYIFDSNVSHPLSFDNLSDGGTSGSPIACLTLKLYLPYILLVFLIGGLAGVLGGRSSQFFGVEQPQSY